LARPDWDMSEFGFEASGAARRVEAAGVIEVLAGLVRRPGAPREFEPDPGGRDTSLGGLISRSPTGFVRRESSGRC